MYSEEALIKHIKFMVEEDIRIHHWHYDYYGDVSFEIYYSILAYEYEKEYGEKLYPDEDYIFEKLKEFYISKIDGDASDPDYYYDYELEIAYINYILSTFEICSPTFIDGENFTYNSAIGKIIDRIYHERRQELLFAKSDNYDKIFMKFCMYKYYMYGLKEFEKNIYLAKKIMMDLVGINDDYIFDSNYNNTDLFVEIYTEIYEEFYNCYKSGLVTEEEYLDTKRYFLTSRILKKIEKLQTQ